MARKPEKADLVVTRKSKFSATVAEFLLVLRLRARRPPHNECGVMQRALSMVLVTCDHWFGKADSPKAARDKPD